MVDHYFHEITEERIRRGVFRSVDELKEALGVAAAWSGFATYGLFKLLGVRGAVRVLPYQETAGMDLSVHGESGYKF